MNNPVTKQEIIDSVDWLGGWSEDGLDLDTCDWSAGDGTVKLEGRKGDYVVYATVQVTEVETYYSPRDEPWQEEVE